MIVDYIFLGLIGMLALCLIGILVNELIYDAKMHKYDWV